MAAIRESVVSAVKEALMFDEQHAKDAEIGVFNWSIDYADKHKVMRSWSDKRFVQIYKNKARSVLANLNPDSYIHNTRLLKRLQEGEFKPHDVAFMAPEHLYPEQWNEIMDMRLKKEENMMDGKQVTKTDLFKCGRCKKNECTYYELQTRSADEPTTIFITCLNCGNRWRT